LLGVGVAWRRQGKCLGGLGTGAREGLETGRLGDQQEAGVAF
jgi:hypothetical protein